MSDNIPPEIVKHILVRLPVKSLLRFRCVSKPWRSLIDGQHFIKQHLNHSVETNTNGTIIVQSSPTSLYYVDLDAFKLSGLGNVSTNPNYFSNSCNGLVLLVYAGDDVVLWNPATRKLSKLPSKRFPMEYFNMAEVNYMQDNFGLGYDSKHDDYKVVRVGQAFTAVVNGVCLRAEVMIYSLKSDSWRVIEGFPYVVTTANLWGAYLNDALITLVEHEDDTDARIMAFDLAREVHYEVPKPESGGAGRRLAGVDVIRGCLVAVISGEKNSSEIWVMMEYGVKGSWCKLLCFSPPIARPCKRLWPLAYSKSGDEVLLNYDGKCLYWYDLREKSARIACVEGVSASFDAYPLYPVFFPRFCVASLVSPYSPNGGVGSVEKNAGPGKMDGGIKKKRDGFLSVGFKLKI